MSASREAGVGVGVGVGEQAVGDPAVIADDRDGEGVLRREEGERRQLEELAAQQKMGTCGPARW